MSQKVKPFQRKVILNNKLLFFPFGIAFHNKTINVYKKINRVNFNLCTLTRLFTNVSLFTKAEYHCHIQYSP